jgi:hypothetical protein
MGMDIPWIIVIVDIAEPLMSAEVTHGWIEKASVGKMRTLGRSLDFRLVVQNNV